MDLKYYLNKARKEHWALGQFNFSTIEQLKGILDAAKNLKSPVILGTSEGESSYMGLEEIVALVEISKVKYKVEAFLNLDHGKNIDYIKRAVDLGYSAVHFDGSFMDLEKNMLISKKLAQYAHKKGALIEGELGRIKGESVSHKKKYVVEDKDLALASDVERFEKETSIDSLAVAIGNIHGVYKEKKKIDLDRLKEISRKSNAFLVLHGGSDTKEDNIKKAIKLGIVKINVNTELRIAWKNSFKKALNSKEIKPYKILPSVQSIIQKKVEEKIKLFGSKSKTKIYG